MKLKKDQVCTWRDLAKAFLKRYKYTLEIAPDRLTFQCMKKGLEEDYREYAIRWKNVASMVRPPSPIDKKIPCSWTLCPLCTMTC